MEDGGYKWGSETVVVQCRTKVERGTSCSVNGEEVEDGPVGAIIQGRNLSREEGSEVLYQNTFSRRLWSLADYLKSNPKLNQEVKWGEGGTLGRLKMLTKKLFKKLLP